MFIFIFIVGFLIGGVLSLTLYKRHCAGTLRIDTSDPNESPYLFLELAEPIEIIASKHDVSFRVDLESYLPQQ